MKRRTLLALLAVVSLGAAPARTPTVHLIGDSTMADRADPANPERGWGQLLPRFLAPEIVVRNHAVNGRSSRSFIDEGRWDSVRVALRPGDLVVIQFGHNDEKREDPKRFTDPYTDYRRNLERFVDESRARGALPVVASSIVRRRFDARGALEDTHGAYPAVARDVAGERGVPFLDLQRLTAELVVRAGPEGSRALYVWLPPGASSFFPEGRQDDTHLSLAGATEVARLAARELARQVTPFARYLREVDGSRLSGAAAPRP